MVGKSLISKGLMALLAMTLVILQGISAAHAIEHHDEHHEHDGAPCTLAVFADRSDDVVEPDDEPVGCSLTYYSSVDAVIAQHPAAYVLILPPARAPPLA